MHISAIVNGCLLQNPTYHTSESPHREEKPPAHKLVAFFHTGKMLQYSSACAGVAAAL